MSAKAFWMFKWRKGSVPRCGAGDFEQVLTKKSDFRAEGFELPSSSLLWKKMHAGDIVFCYQSERRDVLGIARIVSARSEKDGSLYVDLKPLRYFYTPIDIQSQRRKHPRLRNMACFKGQATKAVQRVTSREARSLAVVCRVKTLIRRPRKRRNTGAVSKGTRPQSIPMSLPPEYERSASSWANELFEEYGLGLALEIARIELRKAQLGSASCQLWEDVCEQLRQRGCPLRPAARRFITLTENVAKELPNNKAGTLAANADESELRTESNLAVVKNLSAKEVRPGWTVCPSCGCDLKSKNLPRHVRRAHGPSQDILASVRQPSARTAKVKWKRRGWKPRGSKRLDLSLFPQSRSHAFGSGQSRKSGSHRDNQGHR